MKNKKCGSKKTFAVAVLLGLSTGLFGSPVQAATSTTYGEGSAASGENSTAYGYGVKAEGNRSIAIGQDYPETLDAEGTPVTYESTAAKGYYSVAVGAGAQAATDGTIAIGALATAGLRSTIVVGGEEQETTNDNAVAIGRETGALGASSLALGAYAKAAGKNSIAIGGASTGGSITSASGINAISIGNMSVVKADNSLAMGYDAQAGAAKSGSTAAQTGAIALGSSSRALYTNAIAIGKSAGTAAESALAIGTTAKAEKADTVALGTQAVSSAASAIAIGNGASASSDGTSGIALGKAAKVAAENAIAIGASSVTEMVDGEDPENPGVLIQTEKTTTGGGATGVGSIAFGAATTSSGAQAVAIGYKTNATAANVIAIGNGANSSVANAVVLGASASATAAGVALGYGASVTAGNSVALGDNSVADGANVVSIGSSGSERNLIYVADARGMNSYSGYEAVNWRQLISNNNGDRYTFAKATDGKYVATIKTNATDATGYTNGVAFELELPDMGTTIPVQTVKLSSGKRTYIEDDEQKKYDAQHNQIMDADGKPLVTFEMGKVASSTATDAATNGSSGFISGGDVWNETRADIPATDTDNNYIKQSNTAGANLKALDDVIGQVDTEPTAGGSWNYIGQHGTSGDTTITVSDNLEALDQAIGKVPEGTYTFIQKTDGGADDGSNVSIADNLVNLDKGVSKLIKPVENTAGTATKISIGDDTDYAGVTEVSFGQGDKTRKLTGITAGTDPTDAVNVSQLNVSLASKTYAESDTVYFTEGDAVKDKDGNVMKDEAGNEIKETVINVKNLAMGTTDATAAKPTAGGAGSIALGAGSSVSGSNSLALGTNASVGNFANSVALGYGSVAREMNVISIGGGTVGTRKIVNVADGAKAGEAATWGQLVKNETYKFGADGSVEVQNNNGGTAFKLQLTNNTIGDTSAGTGYVTNNTMYTELRPTDGTYVKQANTTADNLTALDQKIGSIDDTKTTIVKQANSVSANLMNLESAITQNQVAVEAVKLKDTTYTFNKKQSSWDILYANDSKAFTITVEGLGGSGSGADYTAGDHISISDDDVISVVADGKVEAGNEGLVTGGTVYDSLHGLNDDINRVGAGAAALAALHTEQYDPEDKWSFAVGYGHYRSANSGALGAFYKPNEDTTLSFAGTIGNGDAMLNAGVSFKLGQRGHSDLWRREKTMIERMDRIEANTAQQNARIDAQDRIIDMQTQRIQKLEVQVSELMQRAGIASSVQKSIVR